MAYYNGIRVRLRRTNDNAILFDSGGPVDSMSELILDRDQIVGTVGYVLEAMYVQGDTTAAALPDPKCLRQAMVALALHK